MEKKSFAAVEVFMGIIGAYRYSTERYQCLALNGISWWLAQRSPEALAITQDQDHVGKANHYPIAPKDDMPLALFRVWINAFIVTLVEVNS